MLGGHFSGFYPYPFIDLAKLDSTGVLTNILFFSIDICIIFRAVYRYRKICFK